MIPANFLFAYPFYEGFYPSEWQDLTVDNYIKNDGDYEWSGPPLIFFKKEWKNQNVKELDILFSSYIST